MVRPRERNLRSYYFANVRRQISIFRCRGHHSNQTDLGVAGCGVGKHETGSIPGRKNLGNITLASRTSRHRFGTPSGAGDSLGPRIWDEKS